MANFHGHPWTILQSLLQLQVAILGAAIIQNWLPKNHCSKYLKTVCILTDWISTEQDGCYCYPQEIWPLSVDPCSLHLQVLFQPMSTPNLLICQLQINSSTGHPFTKPWPASKRRHASIMRGNQKANQKAVSTAGGLYL